MEDENLLGLHHEAVAGVDPRVLQLLDVSRIDPLGDYCGYRSDRELEPKF